MNLYQPWGLLVLLVVPAAVGMWWWLGRRPVRYALWFPNVEVLARVAERRRSWRRLLPGLLFVLALASASAAVARPYALVSVPLERASVILVFDVSGSMRSTDIEPSSLGAAEEAAGVLLARLPRGLRVGVVAFSSEPQVVAPATSNLGLVRQAIATLSPGGMTAIGDALAAALRLGKRALAETSSVNARAVAVRGLLSIVLLSDGRQNSGRLRPLRAARLARRAGVPVYTVALGSPASAPLGEAVLSGFGPPEIATLRAIATTSGGRFTAASNATVLKDAYARLGGRLGRTSGRKELTSLLAAGAAFFLVAAGLLGSLWSPRLP